MKKIIILLMILLNYSESKAQLTIGSMAGFYPKAHVVGAEVGYKYLFNVSKRVYGRKKSHWSIYGLGSLGKSIHQKDDPTKQWEYSNSRYLNVSLFGGIDFSDGFIGIGAHYTANPDMGLDEHVIIEHPGLKRAQVMPSILGRLDIKNFYFKVRVDILKTTSHSLIQGSSIAHEFASGNNPSILHTYSYKKIRVYEVSLGYTFNNKKNYNTCPRF